MKKHRTILISFFILLLSVLLAFSAELRDTEKTRGYTSDFEHNYFTLKDSILKKYSIEGRNISIISSIRSEDVIFSLFTFNDGHYDYIGNLCYEPVDNMTERISHDRIHSLTVQYKNDTKTPLKIMNSITRIDDKDYCFYYGWINDQSIIDITMQFSDASYEIQPTSGKYFILVKEDDQRMRKVIGHGSDDKIIFEHFY